MKIIVEPYARGKSIWIYIIDPMSTSNKRLNVIKDNELSMYIYSITTNFYIKALK